MTDAPLWINALDFTSIQAAINSLSTSGGIVYIPKGTYNKTTTPQYRGGLTIPNQSKPVHLIGDGPHLTILQANSDDSTAHMLLVQCSSSRVQGFTLAGANQPSGGYGIVVGYPTTGPEVVLNNITLEDIHIESTASWGIFVMGEEDPEENFSISIWNEFNRVRVAGNRADGGIYIGFGNTTQLFRNSSVVSFVGPAVSLYGTAAVTLRQCTFEDSQNSDSDIPYVLLRRAFYCQLSECWFEHHSSSAQTDMFFITLGSSIGADFCGTIAVDKCTFVQRDQSNSRILNILGANSRSIGIRLVAISLPGAPTNSAEIETSSGAECFVSGGQVATPTAFYPIRIVNVDGLSSLSDNRFWEKSGFVAAISMRGLTGSNPIVDFGNYPNKYSGVKWAAGSTSRDGLGIEWAVPKDLRPGTSLVIWVLWSYSLGFTLGEAWVCEITFRVLDIGDGLTASGSTTTSIIDTDRALVNDLFVDPLVTLSTPLPGQLLRLSVNRDKTSASDTYTGDIRFVGLLVTYTQA